MSARGAPSSPAGLDRMDFETWSSARAEALASNPGLLDAAESNLYAALPSRFPGRFESIPESPARAAAHRCHVAELFVARWGWPDDEKSRVGLTRGVRDSLAAVFGLLAARGMRALIPSDVYPAYVTIARAAGLEFSAYRARGGPPSERELEGVGAALVCDPLKPWGGALSTSQAERLGSWARADPSGRLLILDAAYEVDWSPSARLLVECGSAMGLASLSKGWLAPWLAGAAVAPPAWAPATRAACGARPKEPGSLARAYQALSALPGRPGEVASAVGELRERASAILSARGEDPFGGPSGYMGASPRPASWWFERGALAMPASVFGSAEGGSVLSCLALGA